MSSNLPQLLCFRCGTPSPAQCGLLTEGVTSGTSPLVKVRRKKQEDIMVKRAVVLLFTLTLAVPTVVWPQGNTNFSGTWVLDRAKSDPPPPRVPAVPGTVAPAPVNAALAAMTTLRINQTPTQLRMEQAGRNNEALIYKIPGESANDVPNGTSKTDASWDGSKLVLTSTMSLSSDEGSGANISALEIYSGKRADVQVSEIWSVNDGVLTIERTAKTPEGPKTRKLLYVRQP